MFVQFIEGAVADRDGLKLQLDRWHEELAPGAPGWLGTTAGVTTDGIGFLAVRFEDEASARRNADRPEQTAWWVSTEKYFDDVSFTDCEEILLLRGGGSDEAGFVQVVQGRVKDLEAAREMFRDDLPDDERPDVVGGLVGAQEDGSYTMVVYFSSEAEAREGEAASADDDLSAQMDDLQDEPLRFLDLPTPWTWSP